MSWLGLLLMSGVGKLAFFSTSLGGKLKATAIAKHSFSPGFDRPVKTLLIADWDMWLRRPSSD